MDESMKNFIKRGKLYDEGDSGKLWECMVCIILLTAVQYVKLRIIPTLIIVSTLLFFIVFHKKFMEPYGNVFLAIEQVITMFLIFIVDGFVIFSFAVTEEKLYKIILVILLSIVVCGLIKFLYTKNKIRRGGYVNDHPKKFNPENGFGLLGGIIGINIGRMLEPHLSDNRACFLGGGLCILLAFVSVNGIEAWMIYYYFKKLTPEEQDIILEKAEKKAAEEKARREAQGKRTVVAIDKLGKKD